MMEPAGGAGDPLRGALRLGAVTLARHQLALALALGCERIVCLANGVDDDIASLQSATEAVGARFHLIAEPRMLVGLVTAIDDLVALGDGLLAWPATAVAMLEAGPGVLVQPVEVGIAAGFERLDLNHADAGAFRMPGRLVQRLAELPVDCDGFSALQRIALQAGVPQRLLPADAAAQGQWLLVRSEAEAHAAEAQWMRLQTDTSGTGNASLLAAQFAVRQFGPALLHAGSGSGVATAASVMTALLALAASTYHWVATGFVLAGAAWLLLCAAGLLARVERRALPGPGRWDWRDIGFGWAMDAVLAMLMVQGIAFPAGLNLLQRGFAPVMLLGLCRLVPHVLSKQWARWLHDRGALALILALFSAAGALGPGVAALAILLLAAGLYGARQARSVREIDQ